MSDYFDFLNSSLPAEEKSFSKEHNNKVSVTVRVDADCFLLCDGEYLEVQLHEGKLEKVQLPAGQHLLQFMSVEYPEIMTEKEVDFPDAGKSYLVIIKELRALVDAENEKQRLVTEEAMKQASLKEATLERNKYLESIDFVERYINPRNSAIKDEFDAIAINSAIENEIKPAVELGIHSAEFVYSQILRFGSGGVVDGDYSMRLLINAAEGGIARAQNIYANALRQGDRGLIKKEKEAFEWYQRAADQGFAVGQNNLGLCYYNGWGVDKDERKAAEWWQRAADQGFADAQVNLGVCYEYSKGDCYGGMEIAIKWYKRAAEQGHADAQRRTGMCYENGLGVAKDEREAFSWYHKAAEQGNAWAQFEIARRYDSGRGTQTDKIEYKKWLFMSAENGYVYAMNRVGYLFNGGNTDLGIISDKKEAFKWFRRAAELGNSDSQRMVGGAYKNGEGVAKNEIESFQWFLKAAEQDEDYAQLAVGDAYYDGIGVGVNKDEAIKWYQRAAKNGNQWAEIKLKQINK